MSNNEVTIGRDVLTNLVNAVAAAAKSGAFPINDYIPLGQSYMIAVGVLNQPPESDNTINGNAERS